MFGQSSAAATPALPPMSKNSVMKPGTVSLRFQSRCSSQNSCVTLIILPPACSTRRIAERRADAQPVDLFLGLDEPEPDILGVELDDAEFLLQLALLAREERSHEADALGTAPLELGNGEGHAAMLAPSDIATLGELP